ncbi:tyrosine--tRNA ligase [archaeon]|nr:tyrosine--tRNA ligase [archaeon]|tara:strand:- start:2341 stop:3357 length:1017 start_codon:yes stop_codon:yes gene_type:complete
MDIKERLELIKRNVDEVITERELEDLLRKKKKPSVYIGTAITGRPHIGYFPIILKLADFLKAGFKVKLLLADFHGALDNTPWDVLEKRYNYYKKVMPLMFEAIGANISNFEMVKGSSFQMDKNYFADVLKMSTFVSINDCKRAASEVVKFGDNPKLSGLIYPIMQSIDEEYLDVDMQYGGVDQRKILMFARENLPQIGYKKRVEIMTPLIPGLIGKKMSASIPESKVDLLDKEDVVLKKVNKAHCLEGDVDNGLLPFVKYVIMTLKKDSKESFVIERDKKYGGNLEFNNYDELEKAFANKELHPMDLKNSVAREINLLLKPMQKKFKILNKLAKDGFS